MLFKPTIKYILLALLIAFFTCMTNIFLLNAQTEQVQQPLFGYLQEKFEQARKDMVNFYAPQNYKRAFELYESAQADFKAGAKLPEIKGKINRATELLNRAFEATRNSRVALRDIVRIRRRFQELQYNRYAPEEIAEAERHFQQAILKAEDGDIRSARSESERSYQQFRLAIIKWLKEGVLKKREMDLKNLRGTVDTDIYQTSLNDLRSLIRRVDSSEEEKFDPFQYRDDILEKVRGILEPLYPPFYKNLPKTLLIGEFVLIVEAYSDWGQWDFSQKQANGLSGTAWTNFSCGSSIVPIVPDGYTKTINVFQVVSVVTNPSSQISLNEARLIQPDIQIGKKLELELVVKHHDAHNILQAKQNLITKLKTIKKEGDILVSFDNVTIQPVLGQTGVGRIIQGTAAYPTKPVVPEIIRLFVAGFTAVIDKLILTPTEAEASIDLEFPGGIASASTCKSVSVHLGSLAITSNCEFYADRQGESFGSWIIGETGMTVTGKGGYIADFSSSQSPLSKPVTWKGVVLLNGNASGKSFVSEYSNTGYLAGDYSFTGATVTTTGFAGYLNLVGSHNFYPVHPNGYQIAFDGGTLEVSDNRIISGVLGPGVVELPSTAICEGSPGNIVTADFSFVNVQSDMDLAGKVVFSPSKKISWGELTHPGDELIAWDLEVKEAYLYLPAGPAPTFSPDTGSGFLNFSLAASLTDIMAQLESLGMAGITIDGQNLNSIAIYSPDRPGGIMNPIKLTDIVGWLKIGSKGVDGELKIRQWNITANLGNVNRNGYVGGNHFKATLSDPLNEKPILIQYATSAVYDSEINGFVKIPPPCNIAKLEFTDMEVTSTANLVGGDIKLGNNIKLEHWDLAFVHTGSPTEQSGVVSARTGRLIFTAAGIWEEVHFDNPFRLTWCEMYADGNIGELFLDYNTYGQRFDNLPFSAHNLALSKYIPGATGPTNGAYLAVCGTVHFNFFGGNFVNIQDKYYASSNPASYKHRFVTVPKKGEASGKPTNLHLHGEWNNIERYGKLAVFDFPDANMYYNEKLQEGFIGTGTGTISFIKSNALTAKIEVHRDAIDICLESQDIHDVDFGLYARLGSIGETYGCVRIEGPQLKRIVVGGYLETSMGTGAGILAPKVGFVTTVNLAITPNSCTFYSSGDMLLAVAASSVDISGYVHLVVDYSKESASGEVKGKIDCSYTAIGLEGEGQFTWYVDPSSQHFQGKVKIAVCTWTGGAGLEGGLFIGHNVPKSKAWVLKTTSEHFGISDADLPNTLTGLYGYGQVSFSVQWFIFGGGIDLYAGMGVFFPTGASFASGSVLPYVLGGAGVNMHGEILGGLVSASAWGDLDLLLSLPLGFEGNVGLKGCVLWVICASVDVTAGLSPDDGFYLY